MKKVLLIAGLICIGILIVVDALSLMVAVEGIKVGTFDWFPKNEEDIAMGQIVWLSFACLLGSIEIILIFIEIKLIKKLKMVLKSKPSTQV